MAIQSSDILVKLSTSSSNAGNVSAQTNPNASLGLYISTTQVTDNTLDNLFSDISGAQNATGQVDYRCLFYHNANTINTMQNTVVWLTNKTSGGATIALATDNLAPSVLGSSAAQATSISTSVTTPSAVGAFVSPTNNTAGIALGNIGPGQVKAVWIKRTATNSVALNNDSVTLNCQCDTTA